MDQCTTEEELKKVFKKLALKHHPDKGGDPETFNKIKQEYESRLENFKHTPETALNLEITLEEAYTGFVKIVPVVSDLRCNGCSQPCPLCHGIGNIQLHLGPFSLSHPCTMCEGRGGSVPSGCGACRGTGRIVKRTEYTIHANPGICHGDIIGRFNIVIKPHPRFERKGNDLYTTVKIPFSQSIQGRQLTIKHLTQNLQIDTTPWVPIDPRIHHVVKGQGMNSHGDLHIIFDIQYKHES